MANRYWIGRSVGGLWTSTSNWSSSSNGVGGASVPTSTDDVFFDQYSFNSAGQSVVANTDISCRNLNWTGVTNNPLFSLGVLNIYGSLTFVSGMSISINSGAGYYEVRVYFRAESGGPYTITTAGRLSGFRSVIKIISGGTVSYNLGDDLVCTDFVINNGTFNTNTHNLTSTSDIILRDYTTADWTPPLPYGTSVTFGTSTISCPYFQSVPLAQITLSANQCNITNLIEFIGGDGNSYNNLTVSGGVGGPCLVYSSFTANNLTLSLPSTNSVSFQANKTINVGTLVINSAPNKIITLKSSSNGTRWTISSSGTTNYNYLNVKDSLATGGATWNAGPNSVDGGNNVGWYFPSKFNSVLFGAAF